MKNLIIGVLSLTFLAACPSAWSALSLGREKPNPALSTTAEIATKSDILISETTREFLKTRDAEKAVIWVFFTDKGVRSKSEFDSKAAEVVLDARSMARRTRLGLNQIVFADLPVREEYVQDIIDLGAKLRRSSRWLNAASYEVNHDRLTEIEALPFVVKIQPVVRYVRKTPEVDPMDKVDYGGFESASPDALGYGNSLTQLNQISVPAVHDQGYHGEGVTLAILDTGFRKTHEAFAQHYLDGRVLGEWDFVFNDGNTANEPADWSSQWNHGTLIWSVVGGLKDGKIYGPAYKANFLLAKTEDVRSETQVEEDNWVAALQWADSAGADVITTSLGYSDWYVTSDFDGATAVTTLAANTAAGLGIVLCNSMGNSGPSDTTLTAPADAFDILAVGAVNSSGVLASFSSRGPTADGRLKPEVCAMGVSTYSASAGSNTSYTTASGTSLSTPLVAGVACCMVQARPSFTPLLIRQAMMETADNAGSPNIDYGWGIVNAANGIEWGASFTADTTIGEAPLSVQFSEMAELSTSTWAWTFGDGDSSGVANPTHIYLTPGAYDVSLTVNSSVGLITSTKQTFILALGDTATFQTDSGFAGNTLVMSINLTNSQELKSFIVPFQLGVDPSITWDSATAGDRTAYFEKVSYVGFDAFNDRYALKLMADDGGGALPLPPGSGEVMKVYFSTDSFSAGGPSVSVNPTSFSGFNLELTSPVVTYPPVSFGGSMSIITVVRGDVNYTKGIDIADLTYFVAYSFAGGASPVSFVAGDIDASGVHDVTDLTYLVAYMFGGGPPPPPL